MEIITRAQAKAQGLKRYFTWKPCKRGHIGDRRTPVRWAGYLRARGKAIAAEAAAEPMQFKTGGN